MNYYDLIYSPNLNFLTKDNFIDIRSSMLHNGDGFTVIPQPGMEKCIVNRRE